MVLYANASRDELRLAWLAAWQKAREGRLLEPLEAVLVDVMQAHPEYHAQLDAGREGLERDWTVEGGESNPFLHMGLHVALREAVSTDRPPGIAAEFRRLATRRGESHAAEHQLIEVLAETLWEAQRSGLPPDEAAFLERARRLG